MYWKKWKVQREAKLKQLKDRAEGFAELKPRHIQRATQIYKDEFYDKLDKPPTLNIVFDVEYGEGLEALMDHECPLLKLVKKRHTFEGKCHNIPITLSTEKIP